MRWATIPLHPLVSIPLHPHHVSTVHSQVATLFPDFSSALCKHSPQGVERDFPVWLIIPFDKAISVEKWKIYTLHSKQFEIWDLIKGSPISNFPFWRFLYTNSHMRNSLSMQSVVPSIERRRLSSSLSSSVIRVLMTGPGCTTTQRPKSENYDDCLWKGRGYTCACVPERRRDETLGLLAPPLDRNPSPPPFTSSPAVADAGGGGGSGMWGCLAGSGPLVVHYGTENMKRAQMRNKNYSFL